MSYPMPKPARSRPTNTILQNNYTNKITSGVLEHKYQVSLPRLHKTTVLLHNIL